MSFALRQSLKSLAASPFVSAVVTLSLVGGLLAIFLVLGYLDEFLYDTRSYKYGDDGDYYIWLNNETPLAVDEIDPADVGAEDIESTNEYSINDGISSDGIFVCAVDPGFEQYFHSRLISGRYFSADDTGAVIIIENGVARRQGLSVGDSVNILGVDYEIIGIVKMNTWLDNYIVLKSYIDTQPLFGNYFQYQEIVVGSPSEDFDSSLITGEVPDRYITEGWSEDIYWDYIRRAFMKIAVVGVVGLCVFLYATMNLMIIADFGIRSRMGETGLRVALGAQPRQLFFECFIEYLAMTLTASVILIAATPIVYEVIDGFLSWRLGAISGLGLILFAVISAAVIAGQTTAKTKSYGYAIYDMMTTRQR